MCRFVAYLGSEILLADVLVKPVNSIVMQSMHARESTIPTNGDGFGLGWYVPKISPNPALFRSIFPAWSDSNLLHLTAKIQSPCFFAHVRAASVGGTNNDNCHPFLHGSWMLMHNGQIQDFVAVKRHLRHLLDDDIYNWIKGETDSEHLFALFLQLSKGKDLSQLSIAAHVLEDTLSEILLLVKKFGEPGPSYFNICLTDGKRLIATRYCTAPDIIPESLHYLAGDRFSSADSFHNQKNSEKHGCVMIASERLTDFSEEWREVPVNYLLLADSEHRIQLRPLLVNT
jgi:glutamine amidotransferase